jgi:hypothetical protein
MPVHATVRAVFGHFQNLNLLALVQDLHAGRAARRGWSSGTLLCPVAHGLPAGREVRALNALGQGAILAQDCDYAARCLGAEADAVQRFVRSWDEETLGEEGLLRQLQELWEERLADAVAVQELLRGAGFGGRPDEGPAVSGADSFVAPCILAEDITL